SALHPRRQTHRGRHREGGRSEDRREHSRPSLRAIPSRPGVIVAARFQRILLKLSGEVLAGDGGHGISEDVIAGLADEIRDVHALGVQVGIVLGGGNIFRGLAASARGMDRVAADYMGMLATVINSLALQHYLERHGCYTRVMSAI